MSEPDNTQTKPLGSWSEEPYRNRTLYSCNGCARKTLNPEEIAGIRERCGRCGDGRAHAQVEQGRSAPVIQAAPEVVQPAAKKSSRRIIVPADVRTSAAGHDTTTAEPVR